MFNIFHLKSFRATLICSMLFISFQAKAKEVEYKKSTVSHRELDEAQYYFLVDLDTKEVLLSKNADKRVAPSSMTKLMTAYVVFDQVNKGSVKLEQQCFVGKNAWRKSGSSMFLNYGDVVSIDELVKGLLAVSGNDASIVLAEAISGSVDNFAYLMNLKARELGLKNSHFKNPHGLNEDDHYMTMRDLATLAERMYKDFPQYSDYLGIKDFTYRNITQHSRNPLIKNDYEGIVGGKTGHTDDGGYGVVGVVKRYDRRLVAVVNKAKTSKQRAAIITELFDYGFNEYKKVTLFKKDQVAAKLQTWLGKSSRVEVVPNQDISFNLPQEKSLDTIVVKLKYKGPIYAPIQKGDKIAKLIVNVKGSKVLEYDLFAKETVEQSGYFRKVNQILRYKVRSFLNKFSKK